MNRFSMVMYQTLISIILSLSATVIYAEVSAREAEPETIDKKTAVSVQKLQPELRSKKAIAIWELQAEQWELARSGETVLSLPVLNQLINEWLKDKQKKIEIQHPGGEDGELWVQELTDWLVSLGIPSRTIVITPGSGADDVIKFNLIK